MTRANVLASGLVEPSTGIGVVQRALYPRLERLGFQVRVAEPRWRGSGARARLEGFLGALDSGARSDEVVLNSVNPFPVRGARRSVAIVHDLQWRVTKGPAARVYHRLDLENTARRAGQVVTISERVRDELLGFAPELAGRLRVAHLGPGLVDDPEKWRAQPKRDAVLLVGGASHKRNELAADVLAEVGTHKVPGVVGVGLSAPVRARLEAAFGSSACTWLSGLDDAQMVETFASCRYFMHLGVQEGFGLPYIEAMACGAVVLAVDQPLTREILGNAAVLLPDGAPAEIAAAWTASSEPDQETRVEQANRYDWDRFAGVVADSIDESAS